MAQIKNSGKADEIHSHLSNSSSVWISRGIERVGKRGGHLPPRYKSKGVSGELQNDILMHHKYERHLTKTAGQEEERCFCRHVATTNVYAS